MRRTRRPRKCLGAAIIGVIDAEGATGGSCSDSHLNRWRRGKGSGLADRPGHGNGTRIIRSRIGARSAASPIAEAIIGGCRCADRESRATSMPTARGTYMAACPGAHGQVILGAELRRVGRAL